MQGSTHVLRKAPSRYSSLQVLSPDDWQRWHATYTRAASSLEEREGRIAAVAEQLEQGLELLGVTAIEDKLQVGARGLGIPSIPSRASQPCADSAVEAAGRVPVHVRPSLRKTLHEAMCSRLRCSS